jgi:hypothetical protein
MAAHDDARERWNTIRESKPKPKLPERPAEHPADPSSVVVGTPGWEKQLEAWGMQPAFEDDDPFDRRVKGY